MLRLGLLVAVPIVAFDRLTKWWVLADLMDPPQAVAVTSFFNLVLVWNRGVSFGLFDSDSHWGPIVLSAFALAISVVLVVWLRRVGSRLPAVAIGMVLGGAIGNVIDRMRYGAVVDFLDFHAFGYH